MVQSSIRRILFVFVLGTLSASVLPAAPPAWGGFAGDWSLTAWEWLAGAVGLPRVGRVLGPKLGCSIDPDGRCIPATAPKLGCSIDPNGATCVPATAPKHGCTIDPDGRCTP